MNTDNNNIRNDFTEEVREENKMGTMPIGKLLLTMSLPIMASMLVQALYNIVDSIFVARLSEDALTAISMAFPLQTLMIGTSVGTGVGVNAILSKSLGEKNFKRADASAENGIFLALLSYLLFVIIALTCIKPFYLSQTDNASIIAYGTDYLTICMLMSFGLFGQVIFERLLTSTGRTFLIMITQGTGAIINIILDPILIFGLLGMPAFGIKGAAYATIIGQIIAGIMACIFNITKNHDIKIRFKGFRPDLQLIKDIYIIGVPSIIMQCIGSVMTYSMNLILMTFTSTAVAVFGVYFKLQSFIFMPLFGLNNGAVPIIAYNFGARNKSRLIKAWKYSWFAATAIMLFGTLLFEVIPGQMLSLFSASDNMLAIGTKALRIIGIHFPIAAYCIVTGSMFQALGKSVYTMISSIMRQLVVLIPAAYLLSLMGNVTYVWWAFPIAELMSAVASVAFHLKINKEIISKM